MNNVIVKKCPKEYCGEDYALPGDYVWEPTNFPICPNCHQSISEEEYKVEKK